MRKTPLSAPGGSYGRKNNYDWNYRERRGGQSCDDRSDTGYGHIQTDVKHASSFTSGQNQFSPQKDGDDFIPLGYSSPVNNHRPACNSGNWRGQGKGHRHNRGTPPSPGLGFNNFHRRNFYHDTPKSSFNQSNPQRFYQKNNFGLRRLHQRDAHRQVNISNYLDVKSILEDPWAPLVKNLERRRKNEETPCPAMGESSSGADVGSGDPNVESDGMGSASISQKSDVVVKEESETIPTTVIATETTIVNTAS